MFGLLLPKILKEKFGLLCEHTDVIPEFPLRKGLFSLLSRSNQSYKMDFAAFCRGESGKRLVLVELKTDNNSISNVQLNRMKKVHEIGVTKLLQGVLDCACHSKELHKYACLVQMLCGRISCFKIPTNFNIDNLTMSAPELKQRLKALRNHQTLDYTDDDEWSDAKILLLLIHPDFKSSKCSLQHEQAMNGWLTVPIKTITEFVGDEMLTRFLNELVDCKAGAAKIESNPIDVQRYL